VWVHIPKEKRRKLDAKSEKGIFVGYGETTKGFRIYLPRTNTVSLHRDIIVNPNENDSLSLKNESFTFENLSIEQHKESEYQENLNQDSENNNADDLTEVEDQQDDDDAFTDLSSQQLGDTGIQLRPRSEIKRPSRFDDFETSFISITDVEEPTTYEEAMKSSSSKQWQQAIDAELKSLAENDTWDIVDKPSNCDIIDSKWVFKIKRDNKGKISLYKCRLVARGFQQKDVYEDLYSPVAKLSTLRILLAISVNFDWEVYQMDVCSAFLHGEIKENVYLYLPENCNLPSGKVCKLKKVIYGLKRAPKYWYEKFQSFMSSRFWSYNLLFRYIYLSKCKRRNFNFRSE